MGSTIMEPKICPYLGLNHDPNTNTDLPDKVNHCYRAKKPIPVALPHQHGYCLSDEHITCPGYVNGWVNGFPDTLRAYPPTYKRVLQNKWVWISLAAVLLISIYLVFSDQINVMGFTLGRTEVSQFSVPTSTETVQFTNITTMTPAQPSLTPSPPPATTAASTSAVMNTPIPTSTSAAQEITSETNEETTYWVEVITAALNIRTDPVYKADGSNIVTRLRKGAIIEVLDEQKGWLRTELGWIFKAYTRKVAD